VIHACVNEMPSCQNSCCFFSTQIIRVLHEATHDDTIVIVNTILLTTCCKVVCENVLAMVIPLRINVERNATPRIAVHGRNVDTLDAVLLRLQKNVTMGALRYIARLANTLAISNDFTNCNHD